MILVYTKASLAGNRLKYGPGEPDGPNQLRV